MSQRTLSLAVAAGLGLAIAAGCSRSSSEPQSNHTPITPSEPVVLVAADSPAAPVPAGRPTTDVMKQLDQEQRFEEFEQAVVVLQLPEPQEKAFREVLADRVRRHDEAASKRDAAKTPLQADLAAAQAAGDQQKVERIEAQTKAIEQDYWNYRTQLRTAVFQSLSPEQQEYWVHWALFRDLSRSYGKYDLTEAQLDRLWQITEKPAEQILAAGALADDPYLKNQAAVREPLKQQVEQKILTADQRAKLPPPKPTTQPA